MIGKLPGRSLLVADCGIVEYKHCRALIDGGHSFLMRVGGNITLLTELGWHCEQRDGLVSLAGDVPRFRTADAAVDHTRNAGEAAGRPANERVGCGGTFRRRCEGSLRESLGRGSLLPFLQADPGTPNAEKPHAGIMPARGAVHAAGVVAARAYEHRTHRPDRPSSKDWSAAKSRDAVRRGLRNTRPRNRRRPNLFQELQHAVNDTHHRTSRKTAHNAPRKKHQTPPRPPNIKPASKSQIQRTQRLGDKIPPKRARRRMAPLARRGNQDCPRPIGGFRENAVNTPLTGCAMPESFARLAGSALI